MTLRVVDAKTRLPLPGIPTPRLCDEASRASSVEAYFVAAPETKSGGVWYYHVDGFTDPEGEYTKVRVEQFDEWVVDADIQPRNPSDDEAESYPDWFVVEARNEQEARDFAFTAAHEDVRRRYGDEYSSDVTAIRTYKGGISEALARR